MSRARIRCPLATGHARSVPAAMYGCGAGDHPLEILSNRRRPLDYNNPPMDCYSLRTVVERTFVLFGARFFRQLDAAGCRQAAVTRVDLAHGGDRIGRFTAGNELLRPLQLGTQLRRDMLPALLQLV